MSHRAGMQTSQPMAEPCSSRHSRATGWAAGHLNVDDSNLLENFYFLVVPTPVPHPNSQEAAMFAQMLAKEVQSAAVQVRCSLCVRPVPLACLSTQKAEPSLHLSLSL